MSIDWSYEQKIESPPHSSGHSSATPDNNKQSQDELLKSKNKHYKQLEEELKKRGDLADLEIRGMQNRNQGTTNAFKDWESTLPEKSVAPALKPNGLPRLPEHISEATTSNGNTRKFERDDKGRVTSIEEDGRQVWHSDDGKTFRNVTSGETITGLLAIGKHGSYKFTLPEGREKLHNPDNSLVFSDRNGTVTISADGRQMMRNSSEALTATRDGAGRLTWFEPLNRGPHEQPTRIVLPSGKTWEKVDNNLWKDPKTGELLNGSWTLASNGDVSLTSATGKDSVTFKFDGSIVLANEKGLVSQIQDKDGKATHFFYNEQDKLRAMQLPNGTRWTNTSSKTWVKEGSTETWIGTRSIDRNGVLHMESGGVSISRGTDGWERRVSDKGTVTLERDNANGSHVVKNEHGQIIEIRDAIGNSRAFEYGDRGQIVRITNPNGSAWSSRDGRNWTRDGSRPPETREGRAQLSDDGTCRSVGVGLEGYETALRGDGSKLKVEAGNIVSMTTAKGETYHYEYGTDGKLNSVQWPDRNGNIWRTEDGKLWRQFDKDGKDLNREKTGAASVNPDGSLKQSQREGDIVAVRIFKTDGTIYDTFHDWTQRRQKDGSVVFTDSHDRVVRLIDKNGKNTEYGYDESGHLNRIKRPDGTEYTSANGYSWVGTRLAGHTFTENKFDARIEVMKDGTEKQHLSNGNDVFLHTNGAATVHERGLVTVYDNHAVEKAKITETIDRDGNHRSYEYGSVTKIVGGKSITVPDQLTAFQDRNGQWMRSADGFTWQSDDRNTNWKGVAILHNDGSLQRIGERGYDTTEKTDGTFVEKQRTDLQAAAKSMVETLSWSVTTSYNERSERVEQALSGRSAAEVQIIKRLFEQQWNKDGGADNFESVLRDRLSGHQIEKGLAHLERHDDANFSEVKADDAGRIHTALEELGQSWRGRWASNITEDIRSTLSKLNAEQIRQLKNEYQRRFNQDLGHALLTHPKVKDDRFTRESLRIYLHGNDHRSELSMLRLIRLAYQEGNIDRFEEATRNASQKVRDRYIEENGGLKSTISRLQDKFGGIFSDRDFFHARDTIRYGRITEATTIRDATGTFSNDEKTIDKVLREMPEERRAMFFRGEYLSRHPDEIKNKKDEEARDLYRNLSQSFREAYSWAADLRIAQLRDQVRVEGGGLIRELGKHGGAIYASSMKDIVDSVQNLNKKQWDALIGDPDYRTMMEQELKQFLGDTKAAAALEVIDRKLEFKSQLEQATKEQLIALHHFCKMPSANLEKFILGREVSRLIAQQAGDGKNKADPFKRHELEKALALKALNGDQEANDKLRALEFYRDEVYKAQKAGARRDVQESLEDAKGDPKFGIEAILKMTPEERDKYRHNTSDFRTELKTKAEVVFRNGTQSYETALSLLKQIETSKVNEPPKMEIVDKLRMMTYDASRKRGDVAREIDLALKENPELRKRLQTDERFAREFENAANKAFRDDLNPRFLSYEQFVKPILKDESYLPADRLIRLHKPQVALDRHGLTSHLLAMSPETLHKLNRDSKERDKLINALNSEDCQVVDRILRQGTHLAERKLALLEAMGVQNRTSVEKIIAQGGPRSDEEKKLVGSLKETARDTLDKLVRDWQKGTATAADQMRLFVINAGVNSQQVKDLLGSMNAEQRRAVFQEYAAKYGLNNLKRDLLQRAEASDRPQIEYLCRTERLSAGERYNLSLTAATTSDGLSSDLMRYTHYGASRTDMRQTLADLQEEIADANREHRPIDRNLVEKLEAQFREALVNFRESKEQFADSIVNSVITVSAFAAAPFTGGASLYPILYAMAAGATLKLGTHMIVSGADFEATTANISRKLAAGMVEGAFTAINPGQIGALVSVGQRAGIQAAKAASAQLGTNLLKQEGKQLLEAEMKTLIGSALANRAAGASERELAAVAEKMVERGFIDAARKKALTEIMSQSLETAIKEETKTFLKRAQYEFFHAAANATIGAGAAVAGTATDRLLSGTLDGNALRQAGLEGAFGGFFMSAFARGIHRMGHVAGVERAGRVTQYGFGMLQATFSGVAGDVATQGTMHGAVDRGAVASSGFNMLAASGIAGAHQLRPGRIPHNAGARWSEGSTREPSPAVRADQPLGRLSELDRPATTAGTDHRPTGDARQPARPPEPSKFTRPEAQESVVRTDEPALKLDNPTSEQAKPEVRPAIPDRAVVSPDMRGRELRPTERGQDDLNALVKQAESTKSLKDISAIIERIYTREDTGAAKESLSRLASGKSEAAPLALSELLIMADSPKDFATAEKLWQSGDITRWWKEGKLDGCDIFKMTASKDSQLDLASIFQQAIKQLDDRKDLRVNLCTTVAGGGTNLHDPLLGLIAFDRSDTKIPLAVRREAIEQLLKDKPPDLESYLKNIGLAQDDRNFRHVIKDALDKVFEHPPAPQPGDVARPRLLEGKHLERFSAATEDLDWNHPGGVEKRYKAYNRDIERLIDQQDTFESKVTMHLLDKGLINENFEGPDLRDLRKNPKEMRLLLKDTPDLLRRYEALLNEETRLGSERKFFDAVIAERLQGLQTELNKLLESLHLPPTELNAMILDETTNGTYNLGMNRFRIHERGILTDGHPKPDIINTIMHEATHHDQADIVTRWVLDRERVAMTIESQEQLKRVKELFLSETGRELDEKFINQVLKARNGLALNDSERNRAKTLAAALLDKAQADAASEAAKQTASQLAKHIDFIRNGAPVVVVLGANLKNIARMQKLFGANEAPARIQDLTKQLNETKDNSVESTRLHEQLKAEVMRELSSRISKIVSKQHRDYRSRYHEIETFKVGGRAGYLADFYNKERQVDAR
jgi:YD repeat-containing protein